MLGVGLAACGGSAPGGGGGGETDDTTTAATSTDDTDDEPIPDVEPEPASQLVRGGLKLAGLTADQGVEIPIGANGKGIDGSERIGPLTYDRPTLFRAYWADPPEDWSPRDVIGRLELSGVGEPTVLEDTVFIDGPSAFEDLERSFTWEAAPELMQPGVEFRVELWEADEGLAEGPEPDPAPAVPYEGSYPVGIEQSPQEIKMVVVPIRHQIDGCDSPVDVNESELEIYAKAIEQLYPVQAAQVTARDEFVYTESIGGEPSYGKLLSALSQLRTADAPAPNVFYYGVVVSCDGGPGGIAGQAFSVPPPTKSAAFQRVAVGNFIGGADTSKIIMVHEFGHILGRKHVSCAGEGDPDPNYPHPGGGTHVWGWGIHDGLLYDPAERSDYMTYCFTYWVSDYGWNMTFGLIKTFTSWDYEAPTPPQGQVLVGALYADGEREFWVTPGALEPSMGIPAGWLELRSSGELVDRRPVLVAPRPDSSTLNLFGSLPGGLGDDDRLTWVRPNGERVRVAPRTIDPTR